MEKNTSKKFFAVMEQVAPHVNVKRLVDNIRQTNVYTPLVEAISNSVDAVEMSGENKREIEVVLLRRDKKLPIDEDGLSSVTGIVISDTGIGFDDENLNSFNTLYSDQKIKQGGKGFGRFAFLKYFNNVRIESIYKEGGKYFERKFEFVGDENFIKNESKKLANTENTRTSVILENLKDEHVDKLDKKLETVARKLLEKLLLYFAIDGFSCPKITVKEEDNKNSITLNDYLGRGELIQEIENKEFVLETGDKKDKEEFKIKIFKIFYGGGRSSISLVADKRQVTEEALYEYIPEFKDDFYDTITDEKDKMTHRNYIIKTYVFGNYLNSNVLTERDGFQFQKENDILHPFSQKEIERRAAELTRDVFKAEVQPRQERKESKVRDYVNSKAPWYRPYLSDISFSSLPYDITEAGIETELQKIKFSREQSTKKEIEEALSDNTTKFTEKLEELINKITEIGKSDLAHYVSNRKVVLEFLKKLLERNDDGSTKYENEIHSVIFPMGKDSTCVNYEDHNLWLLDERLVFSEFIASDKKINKKQSPKEPDLVVFDKKRAFRSGDNEFSNPLTIFEFKRPKREDYKDEDDPINQIGKYLEEIRAGKYETPKGVEKVRVNGNTPVYGYIICDVVDRIREFAKRHQLTESPDDQGYFGYHGGFRMYIEIISFSKLLKDANIRNKIFFKKLQIE
ncbi:MAG: ATP-binding protein [Patescibacteria group bacterium]